MSKSKFSWRPFYRELADKLLPYKNNREALVGIVNDIYLTLNTKNPLKSSKKDEAMSDIDPFTLLALVNRGITLQNKVNVLAEYKRIFSLKSDIPVDFDGVPQVNNMKAWFFTYEAGSKTKGTAEIDTLWNVFDEALKFVNGGKNSANLIKSINDAFALPQVKWNITMGLFWYFADIFVGLDERTRTFLVAKGFYEKSKLESVLGNAKNYLEICAELPDKISPEMSNYCELSEAAYKLAEEKKEEEKQMAYYLITAIPKIFAFADLAIGDTEEFTYLNDEGHKRQIPRNFKSAKAGDKLICYDGNPTKQAVALGEVVLNQQGEYIKIIKTDNFVVPIDYEDIMSLDVMQDSEYANVNRGTLYKLTEEQFNAILGLARLTKEGKTVEKTYAKTGYNKILYGLPGCGKSYRIEKEILKDVEPRNYIRTTFYQDYSYSDFVGQIMPVSKLDENGNRLLTYEFRPGPFVEALNKAYSMPSETIYLIIEELNRGNAPSIFGDLFQLLDRVHDGSANDGESQYPITNKIVADSLKSLPLKRDGKIFIPSNLVILATMNTSDQNVFTLDTAFKRRWEFEEIKNDFNNHPYSKKLVPGTNVTWEKFVKVINETIVNLQTNMSSSEDKRLGAYFVTTNELSDGGSVNEEKASRFAYKVLEYLWDDVARFNRDQIFKPEYKTLTELIEAFVGAVKLDIFADSIVFDNED